jgi:hypothetical protein
LALPADEYARTEVLRAFDWERRSAWLARRSEAAIGWMDGQSRAEGGSRVDGKWAVVGREGEEMKGRDCLGNGSFWEGFLGLDLTEARTRALQIPRRYRPRQNPCGGTCTRSNQVVALRFSFLQGLTAANCHSRNLKNIQPFSGSEKSQR